MEGELQKTLAYLMRQCAQREYCRSDVYKKALRRLEDESLAEKAVEKLVQEGFVDEERYAAAFVRDKSSLGGWGPIKISAALAAKGIPRETIKTALSREEAAGPAGEEKLRKALIIKHKALKEDPAVKIKLLKFALSRGFPYETSEKAVSEILRGGN